MHDNFLRSWLNGLGQAVGAINFRPIENLVEQADNRLEQAEGFGLERLVAHLYEERSRKGFGDFILSQRIEGFWDRRGTEIDLVAVDEDNRRIRFGTCKRSASKLAGSLAATDEHIARFLESARMYLSWSIEKVAIAPHLDAKTRVVLRQGGYQPQDLVDLTQGF